MILKYKKALILSSLACLLPIPVGMVLCRLFPERTIPGTWITLVPLSLLAAQWLCIIVSALDKSNRNKNEKIHKLILWVIPFLSCTMNGILYALLLGLDFSPTVWLQLPMGLMFIGIGNYMPKTRMNATMGIKIKWTYSSEANWNATHRVAGKVWFAGGLLIILAAFLPITVDFVLMIGSFAVMIAVPMVYSYRFYRKELAEGKELKSGYPAMSPRAKKISLLFFSVLCVFLVLILCTGTIRFQLEETALTIEADWYSDLTVPYDSIDSLEYREESVPGLRVGGFQSFRLLMGFFENEEFGVYTRYTFYRSESCIVLTRGGEELVISAQNAQETRLLYEALLEKCDN